MIVYYVDDPTLSHPQIRELRFTGRFISSMAHLKQVVSQHMGKFKDKTPVIEENIKKLLYVDDLLVGADTIEGETKILRRTGEIWYESAKWKSNSKHLNEYIRTHLNNILTKDFTFAGLMFNVDEKSEKRS